MTNVSFLKVSFSVESETILILYLDTCECRVKMQVKRACGVTITMKTGLVSGTLADLWITFGEVLFGEMALVKLFCSSFPVSTHRTCR